MAKQDVYLGRIESIGGHQLLLGEEAFSEKQPALDRSRRQVLYLLGLFARGFLVRFAQQLQNIHVVAKSFRSLLKLKNGSGRLAELD